MSDKVWCMHDQTDDECPRPPEEPTWCEHDYCKEAARYASLYRAHARTAMSKDEVEEMRSDRELMAAEFHVTQVLR